MNRLIYAIKCGDFHRLSLVSVGGTGMCRLGSVVRLGATSFSVFVSSIVADTTGFGTVSCPIVIDALPGQRINITLYNFIAFASGLGPNSLGGGGVPLLGGLASYGPPQRVDVCIEMATIYEGTPPSGIGGGGGDGSSADDEKRPITVCGGDPRELNVLVTRSSRLRIELNNQKMLRSMGAFVIGFEG